MSRNEKVPECGPHRYKAGSRADNHHFIHKLRQVQNGAEGQESAEGIADNICPFNLQFPEQVNGPMIKSRLLLIGDVRMLLFTSPMVSIAKIR